MIVGKSVGEGDREEFIAMVKIYATERQFPRIFKFFFLFHAWEAFEKEKKQEVTFPILSTDPPYLTPPTKTAKRKKGGRKTFFGWKMKVKLFLIYIYFRCTLKSCLWRWTEFSVSYVWKAQGKEIKRTRRSKRKAKKFKEKQMKLIMDIGLLAWIFRRFPW